MAKQTTTNVAVKPTTTVAPIAQHTATVAPSTQRLTALATAATQRATMHATLATLHTAHKMPVVLASASPATALRALLAFVPSGAAAVALHATAMQQAQQAVYARRVVRTLRPAKLGRVPSIAGLPLAVATPVVVPVAKVAAKAKGKGGKAKVA